MEWPWPHYILQELGFAVGTVISLAYQPTVFTIIQKCGAQSTNCKKLFSHPAGLSEV